MLDRRLQELEGAARAGDADAVLELGGELARAGRTGAAVQALTRLEAEGPPPAREAARRLRREALAVAAEARGELTLRHLHQLEEPVTALGFGHDAARIAAGTAGGTVALLGEDGTLQASAQVMTQVVSSLHFSLCGSALGAGQGRDKPMVLDPRSLHSRHGLARARGWVTAVLPGPAGVAVVAAGEWFRHCLFPPEQRTRSQPLPDLDGLLPPWAATRPGDLLDWEARVGELVDLASLMVDGTAEGPRRPESLRGDDEMILGDPLCETFVVFHRGRMQILDADATEPGREIRLDRDLPRHGWEDLGAPAAALAPGGTALCLGSCRHAPPREAAAYLHRYRPGATCVLLGEEGLRVLHLLEDENITAVAAAPDGDGFVLGTEDGGIFRLAATSGAGTAVPLTAARPPPREVPDLRETPDTRVPSPAEFTRLARLYLDVELPTDVALDGRYLWVQHLAFEDDWASGNYLLYDLARLHEGPAARVQAPEGVPPLVVEDLLGVGDSMPSPPERSYWAMQDRRRLEEAVLAAGRGWTWWGCMDRRRAVGLAFPRAASLSILDRDDPDHAAGHDVGRAVHFCAFSPRGSQLAILTSGGRVEIWGALAHP